MAKLIQPPQKFVPPEWIYGCRYLYANAEAERAAAERLIMESQRTIEDREKTTERLVFDNKKRTGECHHFTFISRKHPVLLCDQYKRGHSIDIIWCGLSMADVAFPTRVLHRKHDRSTHRNHLG